MRLRSEPRAGATAVECAVVYSLTFLLLFGLIVGGLGVFRYQQIASLAREATRWAAVHGAQYQAETGQRAATPRDVFDKAVAPNAVALDLRQLSYTVTWDADNGPYHTTVVNGDVVAVTNTVTVQLTYQWFPEAFFGGVTLTSSSTVPMSY
jgi:Flp pilus assembly protein TadG